MLSYFYWDPARAIFDYPIPLLGRPLLWYGFFFAVGFLIGYWILVYLLKGNFGARAASIAERIAFYAILGTLIGARLGDILFYQNSSLYLHDPLSIFRIWEGGLASHGGAVGILVAFFILSKKKNVPLSWFSLLDYVVIPACLIGALIRVGNFFNQEILGTETSLPWAVVFGHPADGSFPTPRHPVQLYESLFYAALFLLLLFLWRASSFWKREGKISGLFFLLIFGFRFFIEFFKTEQSALEPTFLILGCFSSLLSQKIR
jgi:phosphatidylglycerol---prolipoprotein diacylglyceryl transferase